MTDLCAGCGAPLQSTLPKAPGYLPEPARRREGAICQRCFRITHYGEIAPVRIEPAAYERVVATALSKTDTVLYVIDVFDVSGSLLPRICALLGGRTVTLALNKVDVLPAGVREQALAWVKDQVEATGIRVDAVAAVSARTGLGVKDLADRLVAGTGRVCAVGAANVGKSTLLNRIVAALDGRPSFTTSRVPGTTLGLAEVSVGCKDQPELTLVDTPGLATDTRAIEHLCPACLARTVPARRLRPRVFQVDSGQTLFLGGFARLDFERGRRQSIVCYVSNELVVHRTKLARADEFWEDHRLDLLQVPCASCQARFSPDQAWLVTTQSLCHPAQSHPDRLVVPGRGGDVVLAGLGWLTLFGEAFEGTLQVVGDLGVSIRPRLLGGVSRA